MDYQRLGTCLPKTRALNGSLETQQAGNETKWIKTGRDGNFSLTSMSAIIYRTRQVHDLGSFVGKTNHATVTQCMHWPILAVDLSHSKRRMAVDGPAIDYSIKYLNARKDLVRQETLDHKWLVFH